MTNRFKGLDVIERVPEALWMEVRDIVQETGLKTIPKKKKCKRAKWLSEEALQVAVKRRERLSTPVFWPREFHGLYSPWGRKESDTTE